MNGINIVGFGLVIIGLWMIWKGMRMLIEMKNEKRGDTKMNYTDINKNEVCWYTLSGFEIELSKYLTVNPNRKVTSIVPLIKSPGYTAGYWVITDLR